jgi:hypothetical protein
MAQPISGLESSITGLAKPVTVSSISSTKMGLDVVTNSNDDIVIIDESVAGTTYFGWASPGSSTASAVWKIMKMVESAGVTSTTRADGDMEYNNIWDDRASLTYS